LDYEWQDQSWMAGRRRTNALDAPISIYELHLGSFGRRPSDPARLWNYREIADALIPYVQKTGYTHVEFMPVMEHPFYGSWGYQTTGYFAPTHRYGTPQDFMALVERLHQIGIGVILDWVPSHFPSDEHGLGFFDGTHLYEHADPRKGFHPDWNSLIFNYGRHEVRNFLASSALFWLERYHADALRVDAVASMLYLDYSRKPGQWIPNMYGGRENLEAIAFLRQLNESLYRNFPDVQTIAEESTAWPLVSRPAQSGGLGFGLKWDMGWMHDTLTYFALGPEPRRRRHELITFRAMYAHSENFILSLSHDEVVHGKGSLLNKMWGDARQKQANLRLLFAYMTALPGKKLLFMGQDFGSPEEWNHEEGLDWELLDLPAHAGLRQCMEDLNRLYRSQPPLHQKDAEPGGFEWIDCSDREQSVISFLRWDRQGAGVLAAFNFGETPRTGYRIGAPFAGYWREIFKSDASAYNGSGAGNAGGVWAETVSSHGRPYSLMLTLPAFSAIFFKLS